MVLKWRERGEGDAVLLVHAFPFDGGFWDDLLERTPTGWRLIAPDLRGFGESVDAGDDGPLRMDQHADDLAALLDRLGLERAVFCGLSMGGYIAFSMLRRHPERIRALVLCDTRAGADTAEAAAGRLDLARKVRELGAVAAADAMVPRLLSDRTRGERPEMVAAVRAMIEAQPAETIARALTGLAERVDSTAVLATVRVPTLVVVGAEDAVTPVGEAESMARSIPGARLKVIEGAGHLPNLEQPTAFTDTLAGFLDRLD
jgi:3-oxoadipate enol-lactonase